MGKNRIHKGIRISSLGINLNDINRALLRLSIIFIHFTFFKITEGEDTYNMYPKLKMSIICLLSYSMYNSSSKSVHRHKVSSHLLFMLFLLVPVIHTLTREICYDTIYLYYFIFQLVFVVNSVCFSIHSKQVYQRTYREDEILTLEESIYIPDRQQPSLVYGYSSVIIGAILLSSRLKFVSSVFFFLSITLMLYICIPHYQEYIKIHRSFKGTVMYLSFVMYFVYSIMPLCSYIFLSLTVYIYSCSFVIIKLL